MNMKEMHKTRTPSRETKRAPSRTPRDVPFTMRLPDGRTLCVEVPGEFVTQDRGGELAFLPEGVRFLDRVKVTVMSAWDAASYRYIAVLRDALDMTQEEFAA